MRLPVFLAFRLLLLALLFCPASAAQTSAAQNVTIATPPGWTLEAAEGGSLYFPAVPGGREQATVLVFPELKYQPDPKQYVESLAATFGKTSTIVSQEPVQAQGMPSGATLALKSLLVRSQDGSALSVVVALVQGQDSAVALVMFTPSEAAAQKALPALTGMLTSVRFAPRPVTAQPSAGGKGGPLGLGVKGALPDVKPTTAAQFVGTGGNPEDAVIPEEFRCYQKKAGDSLTPELTVQILPGGKYRTAYGGGTLQVVKNGSLRKMQWTGGPLNGADGYLDFGNFGQDFSLKGVGSDVLERSINFECYQRGPRENQALFEFKLKTPKPANYPCVISDGTGTPGGMLELLSGGQYRVGKAGGRFTVDFRSDQNYSFSDLNFIGGPLGGEGGTYTEDGYGRREVSLRRVRGGIFSSKSTNVDCRMVVKPTPPPSIYGAAQAPAPPRSGGGLSGNWVHSRAGNLIPGLQLGPDFSSTMVMNSECPGNICWEFAFFNENGYVYTGEPGVSLAEADCSRTHPNGLPRCEIYRVQGGKITFGKGEPETFKQSGNTVTIGGRKYTRLLPLTGLKLGGEYTSTVVSNVSVSLGGTVSNRSLAFSPQGQFSSDRSSSTNLAGSGYVLGASNTAATAGGKYTFADNTITLTYGDGRTVKLFAAADALDNSKPSLTLLRLGGVSYFLDDGKK
ncbi:hypothetical protein [Deinococcus sp. AJ005]|uniref:hypothetical protein n=1 Tax=Deinococcus sp. AJ005 TaxID=2652443 RepID=UPI00125CA8A3|nr:hypothetical protein [Deinococcus sp. AJ005]QFP77891.1 head decoration protein [Deinococcus sp. AJ005]